MAHIINQSCGDFHQGGCMHVQANQWHSMDTWALMDVWQQTSETSLSSSRSINIGSGVLVIS